MTERVLDPGEAEALFQAKTAELQKLCCDGWKGRERIGVWEIVRAADYAAFLQKYNEVDQPTYERQWRILRGVAPALAALMPSMKAAPGEGLPKFASFPQIADWTDNVLDELGKAGMMHRLASLARYGLAKCTMLDQSNMKIEIQRDYAESMDRAASRWLEAEMKRRIREKLEPRLEPEKVVQLLDSTSAIQEGWIISYEGHEDLLAAYQDLALVEVLGCHEQEALPNEAEIGGRFFAEWRGVCVTWLSRVFNHIAYATRLRSQNSDLMLRNMFAIPVLKDDLRDVWIEAGEQPERVAQTLSHLTLDATSTAMWMRHHEIPAPLYVDVGGGWVLIASFGGILNPVTGLVRSLRMRHRTEWDRAVGKRERDFRDDFENHFRGPRFVVPDHGFKLRRDDGSLITDVDAVVLDREQGTLALLQLKWLDIFGMSPRERESRRLNLLSANDWVERVVNWMNGRKTGEICRALGIERVDSDKPPVVMVVARYMTRFSRNAPLDGRAAWVAWPEIVRMRVEEKEISDPLSEILSRFKAAGTLDREEYESDAVYGLRDLTVHVSATDLV